MNKVKIKGIPFKLIGDMIDKGSLLDFKAVDRNGADVSFKDLKDELIVVSTFPDINTRVCDAQTQWIAKTASKNPGVKFVSLTTDGVETINTWCASNGLENVEIWSDKYGEFGKSTNTLISKAKKLARGFMVVKDGTIVDLSFKVELSDDPDYELVEKYL